MIKHELWRIVASGLLQGLLNDLVVVTSRDARQLMIENGAFSGKLWRSCYDSLAYVVSIQSINECWTYVADPVYNPHLRTDIIPMVVSPAVNDDKDTLIAAEIQPDGYTVNVFSWDFTEFTLKGPLSEHSQPGTGGEAEAHYVLALVNNDNTKNVGLPSAFLKLTA